MSVSAQIAFMPYGVNTMRNPLIKTTLFSLALLFTATALPLFAGDTVRDEVKEMLLSLKVRTKLLNHLHSGAMPIKVNTEDRTVTLSGEVNKKSDRDLADSVAASVTGVKSVKNDITVAAVEKADQSTAEQKGNALKDALLETRIKTRLITAGHTSAMNIEVESTNGVVSLSGNPSDGAHQRKAMRIARATKGVIEVHDLMKVKDVEAAAK